MASWVSMTPSWAEEVSAEAWVRLYWASAASRAFFAWSKFSFVVAWAA